MNRVRLLALGATAAAVTLAGCATVEEAAVSTVAQTYHANMTGAQEVGGGDPDGSGRADISVSDRLNQVCWDIHDIRGIGEPTAAHIHSGVAGVNGPVVVPLTKNNEGTWKGCADRGTEWTQDYLKANHAAFYVNIHTADYPNGAIRGQLHN
ncbi:CHRD domain-containing protein [Novosphingobium sp. Gsoil 351]|uniref:CHRD domain-containing protein n=1 Tax=Novosphingobium sp. Gsoil 351 TaxID=2675225 RepID=UPI0012B48C82|nr:CHRD domain-containing protein [Novosphingobium sp. Gsoil 351]QGN54751.1 CHRD domain-containing protein [Novosphingobium sp. Gsoil 351]